MADLNLAVDLGGTNTRVALASGARVLPGSQRRYRNAEFPDLATLLRHHLHTDPPGPIRALCAAVAGPVREGRAKLTNHDWQIDAADLRAATGADTVILINDLQAQGYALADLPDSAVTRLFPGAPAPSDAPRLVLNLGTGCNVAVMHRPAGGVFVPAAESGHTTLPHATRRTAALYAFLQGIHPHLPIEAALSGPGLSNIHAFTSGTRLSPPEVVSAFEAHDPSAIETLELFSRILGTVAGNFALHHLPMGGVYLSGGTARAVAPHLPGLGFHDRFIARGPYTDLVRAIPVSVITDDNFALSGCARCCQHAT